MRTYTIVGKEQRSFPAGSFEEAATRARELIPDPVFAIRTDGEERFYMDRGGTTYEVSAWEAYQAIREGEKS